MYKKTYKKSEIKPKNKKSLGNILDYADNNVIYEFIKDRSPNYIVIVDDKEDSWFKYIITYRKKTNVITDIRMIIEKDLDVHMRSIERDGFIIKK